MVNEVRLCTEGNQQNSAFYVALLGYVEHWSLTIRVDVVWRTSLLNQKFNRGVVTFSASIKQSCLFQSIDVARVSAMRNKQFCQLK